jgi:hypothetical protein
MPTANRLQWFEALSEDDLDYLAAYHQVCLGVKLNPAPTPPSPKGPSQA